MHIFIRPLWSKNVVLWGFLGSPCISVKYKSGATSKCTIEQNLKSVSQNVQKCSWTENFSPVVFLKQTYEDEPCRFFTVQAFTVTTDRHRLWMQNNNKACIIQLWSKACRHLICMTKWKHKSQGQAKNTENLYD